MTDAGRLLEGDDEHRRGVVSDTGVAVSRRGVEVD